VLCSAAAKPMLYMSCVFAHGLCNADTAKHNLDHALSSSMTIWCYTEHWTIGQC